MFLINAGMTLLTALHFFYFKMDFIIWWKMSFSKQKKKRLAVAI